MFDTKKRQFSDVFRWESKEESQSGSWLSCIAIGDYLHINTVSWNRHDIGDYVIYSMNDDTTRKIKVGVKEKPKMSTIIKSSDFNCNQSNKMLISGFARSGSPCHIPVVIVGIILTFYHHKKLFKFGGRQQGQFLDSFYIGTLNKGDPAEPIEWKLTPQYTMPHQMYGFGYIHYKSYILTFGGRIQDSKGKRYTDNIYILDLRQNGGWIESTVKCPKKEYCRTVLDDSQRVHLNDKYWTNLSQILTEMRGITRF